MFNALYFEYDGVFSGDYGLRIADMKNSKTETSPVATLTANTVKPSKKRKFVYYGVECNSPPTRTFQILAETPISDVVRREVISWLLGRGEFKKLVIYQPDLRDYYFNCIFSNVSLIYLHGNCIGFELTATFDSIYAYGQPKSYTITGNGSEQTIEVFNESDIIDDYVYPTVSFRMTRALPDQDGDGKTKAISIINTTDSTTREFYFTELSSNTEYAVDNELKIISPRQGNLLGSFSKKWLRLHKGRNILKIKINGEVTIECPQYAILGL